MITEYKYIVLLMISARFFLVNTKYINCQPPKPPNDVRRQTTYFKCMSMCFSFTKSADFL